jgi:filamentous hemagglutinin
MEQYGTGSDMQRAIQAATAAAQGLAGGDMTAALAGAAAPYVAEIIGHRMGLEKEGKEAEKAAAHAVANAVLAAMQGEDALAGAAGALAGELAGAIALEMYGKDFNKLDETEKQTISALATLAAGIAGSVAGDGTASAIAGAEAGKTVVENNYLNPSSFGQGMMGYGLAAQSWNKFAEENGLSIEEKMAGMDKLVNGEKPSWGAEYKVKPYVKGEVAGGAGAGYYFDASIDPNQISANRGETLAVGGRISGQMGIQFGPYLPGIITSERNNSIGLGFGLISGGILYGKDGVGFSIGVGPAWGWSGISTNVANEKIDINGSSGTEFYNYNFGQEKTK